MIRVRCPSCDAKLKVEEHFAGRTGKCPKCQAKVTFPAPATDEDADELLAGVGAESQASAGPTADDPIPFDSLPEEDAPSVSIIHAGEAAHSMAHPHSALDEAHTAGPSSSSPSVLAESLDPHDPQYVPMHLGPLNHYLICDHKDVVARWHADGKGWMLRQKNGFTRANQQENEIPSFGNFILIEVGVDRSKEGIYLKNVSAFQLKREYALRAFLKGEEAILHQITGPAVMNDRQRKHARDLIKEMFLPHMWEPMLQKLA